MSVRPPLRPAAGAPAWVPLGLIAGLTAAVLIAGAGGYGFHRDELYFMEAGRHPAWGYDDQPPLTPLLARAGAVLFGASPRGLRILPAMALAGAILLTGLAARELGAGRRGQLLAAGSLAASGALYIGHLLSTTTFDLLFWSGLLYLATRILARATPRLWLPFGALLGLALLNKWLVADLPAVLALGVLVAGDRQLLRSRWLLAGLALALALWLPNLLWQASHHWPQRTLGSQIAQEDPVGNRLEFLPFQVLIVSPALLWVWLAGLVWLLRAPDAKRFRAFGIAFLALVALCLITGAKEYYAFGFYPLLLAAGGRALDARLTAPRFRLGALAAVLAAAAVSALIALPILPARSVGGSPVATVNPDVLETLAWPRLARWVAHNYRALPPAARRRAVLLTRNYGEAGALLRYGPLLGLPRAYSGHNSFADFGRPPQGASPVVAVGFAASQLTPYFHGCRPQAVFDNGLGADNEEQGAPLFICAGPRQSWSRLWPKLHRLRA